VLARLRRGELHSRLVVMSATLDAERLADHLGGQHLHAEGRTFPVDIEHLPGDILLPDVRGLENRLLAALDRLPDDALPADARDVLVFLPGKGEIASCEKALARRRDLEVLPLHGGLSLDQQSRIFEPTRKRKVILATNVAETSLTVPGVGAVIDSGLVRQTRYFRDRGFLTLVPIALDSADQRAGRAGRLAPGRCLRLWSPAASLEERTPPEIHRESLVPLTLAARVHGDDPAELPFVDPPPAHALETARDELSALGALDTEGRITGRGHRLFGLPLDAALGRWLVEAREREQPGLLLDVVDLVAALAVDRPWIEPPPADEIEHLDQACDAVHAIRAVRELVDGKARGGRGSVPAIVQSEVLRTRRRLLDAFELATEASSEAPSKGSLATEPSGGIDRQRLAATLLGADPRIAHIARQRGRRVGWSNGGTEIELGRESAVQRFAQQTDESAEAILVLRTRGLGLGGRDVRVLATHAMPVPTRWLAEAGLGRERVAEIELEREGGERRLRARIDRVFAKRVIDCRLDVPRGVHAREAIAGLFLRGSLFRGAAARSRENLEGAQLAERLASALPGAELADWMRHELERLPSPPAELEDWLRERLETLGVESGDDLALLSAEDLTYPPLPEAVREELERNYPQRLVVAGVRYRVDYELERSRVVLRIEQGKPRKLPGRFFLPRFEGLRILVEHKGTLRSLD
jgi:ATP-dependent helicase HrpB